MKLSEQSIEIKDAPLGSICLDELTEDLKEKHEFYWIPTGGSGGMVTGKKIRISNMKREEFRVTGAFKVYIKEKA